MRIKEIRRLMAEVGVEDEYVRNWERCHGSKIDDWDGRYDQYSLRDFILRMYDPSVSFNWGYSKEGVAFWRSVYYYIIYKYLPDETRFAKQAMLLIRKGGYRLNKRSTVFQYLKSSSMMLDYKRAILSHCIAYLGLERDSLSDMGYVIEMKEKLIRERLYIKR